MGNPNKKIFTSMKYLSLLSQLGISVIVPPLLCILATLWLKNRFGLGDWVVLVGILIGMAVGLTSLFNYFQIAIKDAKKSQKEYEDKYK